jgi:transposase-like protein
MRRPQSPPRPPLQVMTHARPRCPMCNSVHLRKYRSEAKQGDDSILSWVRCEQKGCGHRFKIIYE